MKIGMLGAGYVARAVAELASKQGIQVMISNSRGPQTLTSAPYSLHCEIGTVEQAAGYGEVVLLAIPLGAYRTIPAELLRGKVVLDAMNYYPDRDGRIPELDAGGLTTSELVSKHLPGARLVKAFNSIQMRDLLRAGKPAGAPDRLGLPLAGDDGEAKAVAAELYEQFGFTPVDLGPLAEGFRFERGTPAYCQLRVPPDLRELLEQAHRS
jgi:8-hydroxy-5-deazaflavin:NADPH oxidoreductase